MNIRLLTTDDAAQYRDVRLRSLSEHPEAFGASREEEEMMPVETFAEVLSKSLPDNPVFGAYRHNELLGIVSLFRYSRLKTRHRMILGGMYVAPEARGQRIGCALLDETIAYAKACAGVEDISLAVTVGNETARRLYIRAGFRPFGVDPRYIRVGDQYFDIEWMILSLRAQA